MLSPANHDLDSDYSADAKSNRVVSKRAALRRAAFWGLAALVFSAACVAMLAPRAAGPGGLVFLLALAAGGLVFLYLIASGGSESGVLTGRSAASASSGRIDQRAVRDAVSAFNRLPDPALLVNADGAPYLGNDAFHKLVDAAGVMSDSARPVGFDRLLGAHPSIGAAIFRLGRAARRGEHHTERLPAAPFGVDQDMRRFDLDVTPLEGGGAMWRARPIALREDDAEDVFSSDTLLDDAPVGFFCASQDGRVAYMNQTLRTWLGPGAERPDLRIGHFIGGDAARALARPRAGGSVTRAEITLKARDGIVSPALVVTAWPDHDHDRLSRSLVYARAGGGAPVGVAQAVAAPDIAQAGASLDAMFANAPFGVARLDGKPGDGAVIADANPAFLDMTDGAGAPGARFSELFAVDDERSRERLDNGQADARSPVECILTTTEGRTESPRYVHIFFAPEGRGRLTAYVLDVSDRKTLESQLSHSRRMQAIGDLAGGVAHDINNKLTAMQHSADDLKLRHPVGDPSYDTVKKLEQNISGAAAMVRHLLAYARREVVRPEVIDVPAFISSHSVWMRQVLHRGVKLETELNRAPAIKMGLSQLEQSLLNLVTNASYAMKNNGTLGGDIEDARGTVRIRTGIATPEERARAGVPEDGLDYAVMEVSDTGCGIPEDQLDQVFDPFFTTKKAGEGTGLGLSTVFGATKQAGGYLDVESKVDEGTTFRLIFPACDPKEAAAAEEARLEKARKAEIDRAIAETDDLSGTDRVMFVDDEPGVRQFAVRMLKSQGYDVIEARDGAEALELLEEYAGKVDLLVSDIIMPEKNGIELLNEAKPHLGDAAVILVSGYTQSHYSDILEQNPDVRFLMKPYTLDQLVRAVKAALATR